MQLLELNWSNNNTNCYAIARMNVIAGTAKCKDTNHDGSLCSLSKNSQYAVQSHATQIEPEPDPLVEEVLNLMPEVIPYLITGGGFTQIRTLSYKTLLDAELFLQNALRLAYQGTWSAITDKMTSSASALSVDYIPPTPIITASVSAVRMHVWLAVNLSLTISSLLLGYLQLQSTRPVMISYILKRTFALIVTTVSCVNADIRARTVLLLDNSQLLARDARGFCNASSLRKDDEKFGRLVLDQMPSRSDASFHHNVLQLAGKRTYLDKIMKSP